MKEVTYEKNLVILTQQEISEISEQAYKSGYKNGYEAAKKELSAAKSKKAPSKMTVKTDDGPAEFRTTAVKEDDKE